MPIPQGDPFVPLDAREAIPKSNLPGCVNFTQEAKITQGPEFRAGPSLATTD